LRLRRAPKRDVAKGFFSKARRSGTQRTLSFRVE
jgi:hypothetical protein